MLKLLLLLCWTTILVTAIGQKYVVNDTNIPTNEDDDSIDVHTHLPLELVKLPIPLSDAGIHISSNPTASSTAAAKSSNFNSDIKSNVSTSTVTASSGNVHSTNVATEIPNPSIPPNPPITISVPTTTTPAPSPTPLPSPSTGTWTVHEKNISCIIVHMAVQFNISYVDARNVTIHKAMDVPVNSTARGMCGPTEQNLTLSWGLQNATKDNFTLHFVKNETSKHYSLHHLEISFVPDNASNETVTLVHEAPQFSTGLENSYRCRKQQSLNLTLEHKNETLGHLEVSDLQFQAFRSDNSTTFGLAKDCAFDTPDIVPITVGCALAGLVVIVLIAYLVGRRRSQARGYLSM